jgi:hypothetical protein
LQRIYFAGTFIPNSISKFKFYGILGAKRGSKHFPFLFYGNKKGALSAFIVL